MKVNSKANSRLIAIGSAERGTAFPLYSAFTKEQIGKPMPSWPKTRFEAEAKTVCAMNAQGKECGVPWVDSCSWLATDKGTFVVLPLSSALSKGLVRSVKAEISRDGAKAQSVTLYVHKGFDPAKKLPHAMACLDVKAGRVEVRLVSDSRNASLVYRVKLAEVKSAKASK